MLIRTIPLRQKDVCIINDIPVKAEIQRGDKFSAISNMNMLTAFRKGTLDIYSTVGTELPKITYKDIYTTYLDYTYYGEEDEIEKNFDFNKEFRKRKDLTVESDTFGNEYLVDAFTEAKIIYYKLEHQKDVYVSARLYFQFKALLEELEACQPKLIICTGKWSLFFLTGCSSLTQNLGTYKDKKPFGGLAKFRSSILKINEVYDVGFSHVLVPIYHPVNSITMPDKAFIMDLDIQKLCWMFKVIQTEGVEHYSRSKREYVIGDKLNIVTDYFAELLTVLDNKPTLVSIDIETFFWSVIDCVGLTYETNRGFCLPFASKNNPHIWDIEDEVFILAKLKEILQHPNCRVVGQNFSFDGQYFHKLLGIRVDAYRDTMILAHCLRNYLPKDLGFLASLYSEQYSYWKADVVALEDSPETRWRYNIDDICYTLEVLEAEESILAEEDKALQDFYNFQQHEIAPALVDVMNKGIKVDLQKKQELLTQLQVLLEHIEKTINSLLGFEINLKSSKQIKNLFTDYFNVKGIISKKSRTETFGSEAMFIYLEQYPLLQPLITLILEYRTIGIFVRTFLSAQVDEDGRMRTSYNVAGTKSYRLSSRKNAFGRGMNLANIPSKGKINLKYALMEYESDIEQESVDGDIIVSEVYEGTNKLPNCKELFLPDEGYNFFNIDYSGADAMVVAWDSDCEWLQNFFNTSKEKLYIYIAREYLQRDVDTNDPFYKKIKQFVHLTNYGGMEEKAATSSGLSVQVAKELKQWYFGKCPEIPDWHKRIASEVKTKGYIRNIFGAKFWLLDSKCPTILNQAYALIPQSTIAILVNKGLVNVHKNEPNIDVLMQIHDAIAGQFLKTDLTAPARIEEHMRIVLPYKKPLIIPADITWSSVSYGDC